MRTLTFEQVRINLTSIFDNLDEPVQVKKRGKVVGYIVKTPNINLQSVSKNTGICLDEPEPEKVIPAAPKQKKVNPIKMARQKLETIITAKRTGNAFPKAYQTRRGKR